MPRKAKAKPKNKVGEDNGCLFGHFTYRAFAKVLIIASERGDPNILAFASELPVEETLAVVREHADPLWEAVMIEQQPKKRSEGARLRQNAAARRAGQRRRDSDPIYRLLCNVRAHVGIALRRRGATKTNRLFEILNYTPTDLMAHLSALLEPGMTWENYGHVWHVDHKRPVSWYDFNVLDTAAVIRECWALSNLQPLFAIENLKKGNRYLH